MAVLYSFVHYLPLTAVIVALDCISVAVVTVAFALVGLLLIVSFPAVMLLLLNEFTDELIVVILVNE